VNLFHILIIKLISGLLSIGHYRHIVYTDYTKNSSGTQKFIELWTDKVQTGDNALVQSKGMKTVYINSIRIIKQIV